jgi:ABC-type amino acid transport substrate-binding protein
MLEHHRGDLIIDITRLGFEKTIVDTGVEIGKMPFFLLIRKNSSFTHLLNRFDEIIVDMTRDGTLATIIKKYE